MGCSSLEISAHYLNYNVGSHSFQMSVVEFLNVVEEPLKDKHLPLEKGKTIYTSLLGTAADLTPMDNVKASVSVSLSPFGSSS